MPAEVPEAASAPSSRWQRLITVARTDARRLITTGVPHLFVAAAFSQGMGLLRRLLLARMLSVEELGQMAYAMQIAELVAIFADIGICTAVLKYASEPSPAERKRALYVLGLLASAATSTLLGLAYFLSTWLSRPDAPGPDREIWLFMLILAPYIPLAATLKTPLVYMQALKQNQRAATYSAITQALSLVVLVAATWRWRLWGFFLFVSLAPCVNLIMLLAATRRELHVEKLRWRDLITLVRFGFFSMLGNAAGYGTPTLVIVLLRALSGSDAQVGLLATAQLIVSGIRLLPTSLMSAAFPYLSSLRDDLVRLRNRVREIGRKQGAVVLAALVAWTAVGYWATPALFGGDKAEAFVPSVILLLGLLIYSLWSPPGLLVLVLGRVYLNAAVSGGQLLVSGLLGLVLIPRWGVLGAAATLCLSEGLARIATLIVADRALRQEMRARARAADGGPGGAQSGPSASSPGADL